MKQSTLFKAGLGLLTPICILCVFVALNGGKVDSNAKNGCGQTLKVINGSINYTKSSESISLVGSKATVTCVKDTVPIDSRLLEVTCRPNGKWSAKLTDCMPESHFCRELKKQSIEFENHCFVLQSKAATFDKAKEGCLDNSNGRLAVIDTNSNLTETLFTWNFGCAWVALRQIKPIEEPGGSWHWLESGSTRKADDLKWTSGQPDDQGYSSPANCGCYDRTGRSFRDNGCEESAKWLCMYPLD